MKKILAEGFWLIIAVAIVAGGVVGFQALGANAPVVEAQPVERPVVLAEVQTLEMASGGIPISTNGFMSAARQLDLAAETGGRITELHPAILERGQFAEGDVLLRLDDRQALASLAQITANRESALAQRALLEKQLDRTRSLRQRGIVSQGQLDELESREAEIKATLRGLEANEQAAELSLANTVVRAPFNGRVLEQLAEEASVVSTGTPVARIYSDDEIEVEIAIREDEAALLPDLFGEPQVNASVETDFAGRRYGWDARIARVERRIDDQTRTIDVTLVLANPDQGSALGHSGDAIPALLNAYVDVSLSAPADGNVFVTGAQSIRNGNQVLLANEGRLSVQRVQVLHRDGANVYFQSPELEPGAEIIISPLASVTDGMEIEVVRETASLADAADATGEGR
ncbi:MAG: efflux RND transporter periplasmic adaptor subunit [Pseudomonadota bacterium]